MTCFLRSLSIPEIMQSSQVFLQKALQRNSRFASGVLQTAQSDCKCKHPERCAFKLKMAPVEPRSCGESAPLYTAHEVLRGSAPLPLP